MLSKVQGNLRIVRERETRICNACTELDRRQQSNLPIDPVLTLPSTRTKNALLAMQMNLSDSIRSSLRNLVSSQIQMDPDSLIQETTLIRNGSYCGRRFSLMGYSLVWFQEEGQIKLYTPSNELIESCKVHEFAHTGDFSQPWKRAA